MVGKERKHYSLSTHARSRVVIVCVDAAGNMLPPMYQYRGGSTKNPGEATWDTSAATQKLSSTFAMKTKGGGTTDEAFRAWAKDIFIPWVNRADLKGPKVLLLDNLACHKDTITLAMLLDAQVFVKPFPRNGLVRDNFSLVFAR